jgi:hypothetical protein
LTLKELLYIHDSHLLNSWDQTAIIVSTVYNLTVTVSNALGGKRSKPKSMFDLHPYRDPNQKPSTKKINTQNFGVLRDIANSMLLGK